MNTLTAARPRVKAGRTVRLALPLNAGGKNGLVTITERAARGGAVETDFFVDAVTCDFGPAGFRLTKLSQQRRGDGDDEYQVHFGGRGASCTCKGFLRWGHCRHASGLAALHDAGQLPFNCVSPSHLDDDSPF